MCRGLGRIQRLVLGYLDEKAKTSNAKELKTVKAYASASEITHYFKIRSDVLCQATDSLIKRKRIRVYPNGRKRNRHYGSTTLPSIEAEDVAKAMTNVLSTNNR